MICGMVVATIVLATHWPALSAQAITFDDDQYLFSNPLVQNPSWAAAKRFLTEVLEPSTVAGYYQPLAMISLMLDHATGGSIKNLRSFHRTSLALHVCNTLLVIILLFMLFNRPVVAALIGLLFGLHPMTVETISWVGERKTVLAAFFALWSLIFYVRYARTQGWKPYALCLATYILALMSKPTSTPLPAVMLLMDFWPLHRLNRRAFIEKLPFFAIGGVSAIITIVSQDRTAVATMPSESSATRILFILCHNVIFYLYKIVWPTNLCSHYVFPDPLSLVHPRILIGVIGTCLLIPALLISLRWTRSLLTGWLIFFIAIFPTMGVIGFTTVIASDKFAYLPSIGLMMIATWAIVRIGQVQVTKNARNIRRIGILLAVVLLAIAEGHRTRDYLQKWQDSVSLHQHMLQFAPRSAYVHNALGVAFREIGRMDKVRYHLEQAIANNPNSYTAHGNLANFFSDHGQYDQAIVHLKQALKLRPDYSYARFNLASIYYQVGKVDESLDVFTALIKHNPDHYKAYNNRGCILLKQKRYDEALRDFTKAAQLYPDYADAHVNVGLIHAIKGETDKAIDNYHRALQCDPDLYSAHYNLAEALSQKELFEQAIDHYRQTLELKPSLAKAHAGLGAALKHLEKPDEAIRAYQAAVQLKPTSTSWRCCLAELLLQQNRVEEATMEYRKVFWIDPQNAQAHEGLKAIATRKKP